MPCFLDYANQMGIIAGGATGQAVKPLNWYCDSHPNSKVWIDHQQLAENSAHSQDAYILKFP